MCVEIRIRFGRGNLDALARLRPYAITGLSEAINWSQLDFNSDRRKGRLI